MACLRFDGSAEAAQFACDRAMQFARTSKDNARTWSIDCESSIENWQIPITAVNQTLSSRRFGMAKSWVPRWGIRRLGSTCLLNDSATASM